MSNDKMARLQNAVVELAGWSGNDIAGLIEDGLIEGGDLESIPTPPAGEPEREALREVVAECLRDITYTCGRVWEAWQYGTMTQDDFSPAWEDDEVTGGIVDAILAALPYREPEPREVTTFEELDALPLWSIVKGLNGVGRKTPDGWLLDGYIYPRTSEDLEEYLIGPFLILFTPPVTPSTEQPS
ncbi:hypothetical protein [Cryobacterium sp. GrIS_2_6]|uniref:hypothetical protein n=1 Tax=Cryobacterium sp. GrIS_2_6 TaxID=3162785 RepID=UPI002DFAF031|nr:hypothetical protein [Cryobacterium psychrotolerans]MEC5149256.1 hypothetical protein [Cryobacterium psychrotolerans]MEC5149335.1 hypothetical protein [Cryobacterium psychrotolerans]